MPERKFRGDRLKSARLYRGYTITELENKTGITKQSLSQYEKGDTSNPSFERIFQIAQALEFPVEFFLEEDECKTKTEVTYFRSLASATRMSRKAQSVKLEYVAKIYEILSNYIEFPKLNLPDVKFTSNDNEFDDDAEQRMRDNIEDIATQVREEWGLGDEPIRGLQQELQRNGLIVTGFSDVDSDIDAFSQRTTLDEGDVYFIAVSLGTRPKERIRFDMAHELGHILMHPWTESLDLIEKEEFNRREKQANMFASAFLLPADSFRRTVGAYATDLDCYRAIKSIWGCSIQAMIVRAHDLDMVTDNQYQYMMRQVSKRGWRKHEPGDVPYIMPEGLFQDAIDLLKNGAHLSTDDILNLFSKYGVTLYPKDLEKLLHLTDGTLQPDDGPAKILKLKDYQSSQ